MRVECKNYESRTYPNGETVRKCNLDLAPDAPWRCPDECPKYERRLADVGVALRHLDRTTDSQGAARPRRRERGRVARRGRGHHQQRRAGDPRRGAGRARSAPVLEASAPQAIASEREPLHRRRGGRASRSPLAAGSRGAAAERALASPSRPRPRRSGATAASASSTSIGMYSRSPVSRRSRRPSAIAAAVAATRAAIPSRAAFVMLIDGQVGASRARRGARGAGVSRCRSPATWPRSAR